MRSTRFALIAALLVAVVSGCDSNSLDDPEHVRTWATNGSALAVYSRVHEPFAYAFGESTFADADCPVRSDDGDTVTITGGCAEAGGQRWSGTAIVTRGEGDLQTLTLDGFGGYTDPDFRTLTSGTATVMPTGDSTYAFDVDITAESLTETRITYAGTVEGDYSSATIWNGSGSVTRDGFGEPTGTVSVSTTNELRDSEVCGQPVSGETTIESGGDRVVVTYDGASDCDDDHAATWTLNGQDQGRITGIDCSAGGGGGSPRAPLVVTLAMVALGLVLARRARRR